MNKPLLFLLALVPLGLQEVRADVKMPALFGDHMVLQQEATVPVWGWADAGEKVTVDFGGKKATATAGTDGKWRVDLPALPAGTAPGTLTVAGKNTLTFSDVLVGDVWICSGQSNMEYGMSKEKAADANDGQIRLFHVANTLGVVPLDNVRATWQVCSPATLPGFTAVGYFFAKNLRPVLKRPIGLIESNWGGTPAQSWTDLPSLQANPALEHYAADFKKAAAAFPGGQPDLIAKIATLSAAQNQWNIQIKADTEYQAALKTWTDAVAAAKAAGQPAPAKPLPKIPRPPGLAIDSHTPTSLFNGMINPLIPFAIKGAIWYQGESNAGAEAVEYRILFPAMITNWRSLWKEGDFPFLFVQLANYGAPPKTAGEPSAWAVLRESQLKTLSLQNTGMAVIDDIGTGGGIHPPDKEDVGARLALAARHVAYGENLVYTGPIYDALRVADGAAHIVFKPDSIGGGLIIGSAPWVDPAASPISKTDLVGFAIAGEDKKWVWATAKIESDGKGVVVSSPEVPAPVAVRYMWASDPAGNLYNKEGLPASPFRTDDWEDVLPPAKPAASRAASPAASPAKP